MLLIRSTVTALLAVGLAASLGVDAAAQTADERALATYRLTMPNVKKVMAVMKSFADEAAKDPKTQELEKLKKQLEPLHAKDELNDSEQAQLDRLQDRINVLENEENEADANDEEPTSNAQTLASIEASIKKHPAAASALAREGLTARDYSMTLVSVLQASMIEAFSQGKLDIKTLPRGVNPENILFVREHKAELEAMHKAMAPKKE